MNPNQANETGVHSRIQRKELWPKTPWGISRNSSTRSQRVSFYIVAGHCPSSNIHAGGKKTFGNLLSKVKAKIQEFDQGRWGVCVLFSFFHYSSCCLRSTGQTSTQPTRDANTNIYNAQGQAQPAAVAQPSYFDPNSQSSFSTPLVAHQSSPAPTPVIKGYELSPSRSISKW